MLPSSPKYLFTWDGTLANWIDSVQIHPVFSPTPTFTDANWKMPHVVLTLTSPCLAYKELVTSGETTAHSGQPFNAYIGGSTLQRQAVLAKHQKDGHTCDVPSVDLSKMNFKVKNDGAVLADADLTAITNWFTFTAPTDAGVAPKLELKDTLTNASFKSLNGLCVPANTDISGAATFTESCYVNIQV